MITLEAPHMGLNDPRSPSRVNMWNTWDVKENETVVHMLEWIATVARTKAEGNPEGKLKNLVFNCHGGPASLQMGEGIEFFDTRKFRRLEGLVEKIWFNACEVAKPGTGPDDGLRFCSEIAKAAQCYVLASDTKQADRLNFFWWTDIELPFGKLGTFEGTLLSFGPTGKVTWSHTYPAPEDWLGRPEANPD